MGAEGGPAGGPAREGDEVMRDEPFKPSPEERKFEDGRRDREATERCDRMARVVSDHSRLIEMYWREAQPEERGKRG